MGKYIILNNFEIIAHWQMGSFKVQSFWFKKAAVYEEYFVELKLLRKLDFKCPSKYQITC